MCVCEQRVLCLRWQDLSGHEDLLHQLRQDGEEVCQVQTHVLVLLQLGGVQLESWDIRQSGLTINTNAILLVYLIRDMHVWELYFITKYRKKPKQMKM